MLSAIYHIFRVCKIRGSLMPQISTARSPMWVKGSLECELLRPSTGVCKSLNSGHEINQPAQ